MDLEKLEIRLKEISGGKTLNQYKDIPYFQKFTGKIDEVIQWIDTYDYAPKSPLFYWDEIVTIY